jgi:hypothetical protein
MLTAIVIAACSPAPAASPSAPLSVDASAAVSPSADATGNAGAPAFVLPRDDWQIACEGIDPDACRDMAEGAAGSRQPTDPPLHTVLIRCTTPPCTTAGGSGDTILVFADGSSRTVGSWSYSSAGPAPGGGQPLPPEPSPAGDWELICDGVPRDRCEEFATTSYESINELGRELVAITVVCHATACTDRGQGVTLATFADGSQEEVGGWDYDYLVAPPLPAAP